MGGLAAVISRLKENVIPEALRMLNALKHRGTDAHGISTDEATIIGKSLSELSEISIKSEVALGYNFSRVLPNDQPQPIEGDNFKIIFDGRIFSPPHGIGELTDLMKRFNGIKNYAKSMIGKMDGSFSFIILKNGKLFAGRDPMGAIPLYFGENERFYALASERKALWLLGIENNNVRSFPPGNLAEISSERVVFQPIKLLDKPKVKPTREEDAVRELHRLLLESVRRRTAGLEKASIAFSGGLDSSVIAALARDSGVNLLLISVGLEGAEELEHAEKVAEEIGLPFEAETYKPDDVEEALPKVLWLIEKADVLGASIFIPMFWTAEVSARMDRRIMLSGQGCDELFAGYHKYLKEYGRRGRSVEQTLYYDVFSLHEVSLEAENKICSFHRVEARSPYVNYEFASFALNLPITLKIWSENDPLRKRVLRRLALQIGLPPEVSLKPKKAIQYGTGVSKVLKKMAKKRGLNMRDFIKEMFQKVEWFR